MIPAMLNPRTVWWLLLALTAPTFAAERKPNFIFLCTDDQRWDALGVVQRELGDRGRFPWFQTPNLDRLAAEGVRFRNAFVTSPLCSPARAGFLTGRYNHLNGVANNRTPFPTNSVTYATLLRAAGYKTAYIGKWHMDAQRGPRPGFDYSASFIGQGKYFDCPFEINGETRPTRGWVDDVATDFALEFLRQHREQPFLLALGFKSPHGPRGGTNLPERLRQLYAGEKTRPVPNLGSPAIFRSSGAPKADSPRTRAVMAEADTVPGHLDYLRHIAGVDENVGRLLRALDELGLTTNTVVIFTSDNGYYLGEHGLGDKRSLYEESIRVPLLVRWPGRFPKGATVDELALNLDLAPTLLELAGVRVPSEMQGRSWVPLLTGQRAPWRSAFLMQYFFERGFGGTPTVVGVRTATAKLIRYPGHEEWTELFDLVNDPYETNNLARDPAHRTLLAQLQAELDAQMKRTGYRVPDYADNPAEPDASAPKPRPPKSARKQVSRR